MTTKCRVLLTGFFSLTLSLSCVTSGGQDPRVQAVGDAHWSFVEMLRDQKSLTTEKFRELVYPTDPATSLQRPVGVFADPFRVYVAEAASSAGTYGRVFIFDRIARSVTILGSGNQADDLKLLAPAAIAVDSAGTIFIADSQQGKIFGYDKNGRLLLTLGKFADFSYPTGLAVDSARNLLYVADSHGRRVKVFTTLGVFLYDLTDDIGNPAGISLSRDGSLYILDDRKKRVAVYNPDGVFLRSFSVSTGTVSAPLKLYGIAVDSEGYVYITDTISNAVLIFDPAGKLSRIQGKGGQLAGDFLSPSGIFIDDQDLIYIADQLNGRVQVFRNLP